jgi:MFS transporter, DHA1 family, tetracycline resistance protein
VSDKPTTVEDAPQSTSLGVGKRKAALGFIFATALMDVIALGIMIPVLPNLVKEMVGGDTATATHWTGIFALCWGLMQFFCSPIMGMLSDRFGRRPILLISIFGLGVDYVFMALSPTLAWLFVGRLINGATSASFSTAGAYIADITAPENRAKSFGLLGAAFGIGFIIGPAIGGYLGEISLRLPFYFAAGMALINWLYGFLILPESLPREKRAPRFIWAKANPVGSFRLLRSHKDLIGLAGVGFLFQLAHNVFPSIFVLYTGYRFGWTPGEVGLMLMATGLSSAIVQFTLVGPAVKKLGERGALLVGLMSAVAGFFCYALAPNGFMFALSIPVFALAALIGPGMQGLMTRRVSPSEQGQLQGANSAIMGITAIIGPPIFTTLFAYSITHADSLKLPGLPLYAACLMIVLALGLAFRVAKPPPKPVPESAVAGVPNN